MPSASSNGGPGAEQGQAAFFLALDRLAAIAQELDAVAVQGDAREASARLAGQRFFVACLGQFKRGGASWRRWGAGRPESHSPRRRHARPRAGDNRH